MNAWPAALMLGCIWMNGYGNEKFWPREAVASKQFVNRTEPVEPNISVIVVLWRRVVI